MPYVSIQMYFRWALNRRFLQSIRVQQHSNIKFLRFPNTAGRLRGPRRCADEEAFADSGGDSGTPDV
jgi:hypothetical protein